MSDKQYDSVLVGYVDEPRYYEGELGNWSFSMTVDELQDVINNYASKVQEDGKGGASKEVYLVVLELSVGVPHMHNI